MRKLIAGMKISVDGKIDGPTGVADWVAAWSDDYGLTPQVDACVLGSGMYAGYEAYWTAIRNAPDRPVWEDGNPPTPAEIAWANFAADTPHYVLSRSLDHATWPSTRFIRSIDDIAALKREAGKDIYLVGGGQTIAAAVEARLLDELRLIVYPLVAGEGRPLFAANVQRQGMALRDCGGLADGRVRLTYALN